MGNNTGRIETIETIGRKNSKRVFFLTCGINLKNKCVENVLRPPVNQGNPPSKGFNTMEQSANHKAKNLGQNRTPKLTKGVWNLNRAKLQTTPVIKSTGAKMSNVQMGKRSKEREINWR